MTPTPEQLAAAEQIDLEHVKKVRNCVVFIEAPNGVEETQAVIDLIPALVHLLKQARAECDYNLRACNDAQIIIRETRMERDAEWQRKDDAIRAAELYKAGVVQDDEFDRMIILSSKWDEADALLARAKETSNG